MINIGVLGAGSWGIAISLLLKKNGHNVSVWSAVQSEVDMINSIRENTKCLPGVKIPEEISFTTNKEEFFKDKDLLVMAVASPYVRSTSKSIAPYIKKGQRIVNLAKGIEEDTMLPMTDIILSEIADAEVSVLSGPSHAEEVSRGIPTTCVIGAQNRTYAEWLQNIFMSEVFRVYISPDILGIELGGSLKNVIALAAGMADGLGYGDNTKAALITRGIHEISRLGTAMGGKSQTFYGLSGIGDLIVTCASMHSRNRRAGILIGQGRTMKEAMDEVQMVVEGVYSAKAAKELSDKYHIDMPIVEQVNKILFEEKSAADAVKELMLRDKKIENSEIPWD